MHVSEPPWWVYVGSAASILWFQTMDALDGKQVRKIDAIYHFVYIQYDIPLVAF